MVNFRNETPPPPLWEADDIMSHLGCDKTTAENIMSDCRKYYGIKGYGAIEKHLILDFINEKQRQEREREVRYNADIALTRQVTALEEQVKALKEQNQTLKEQDQTLREQDQTLRDMIASTSADARKARTQALIANFVSGISITIALLALILK